MAKYLNLAGLQTLWTKLKDTFALKKHSHTVEDIPVDSALSSTSVNPVQNKVVNSALDGKANTSGTYKGLSVGSSSSSFAGDSNLSDLMHRFDYRGWTLDTPSGEVRQIKKTIARDEVISIEYHSWKPCRIRIRYSIKTNLQRDDGEGYEEYLGTDLAIYFKHNSVPAASIIYSSKRVYGSANPEWVDVDVTLNIDNKGYDTFYFFFQTQNASGTTGKKRKGFVWIKGLRIERLPDTAVAAINDKNGKDITSRYVPISRAGIYGCRVKRAKTGGNWHDNAGFQIVESYASSFRTHWVTFRWSSAAQMNGTTERGCRRFLFGYEETGRFLRCFVSEDDSYWYVWILFMNAKTGGALGSNNCSVMEMQTVANGLEVLTSAPDLTTLTEIPWAADERYAPKSHTHDDRYYTETEINSKNWLGAYLIKAENDLNTLTHASSNAGIYLYKYEAGSKPLNLPTDVSGSGLIEHITRLGGISNNQSVQNLYCNDFANFYYSRSSNGSSWNDWKKVYYEATSTYSATGTQAVNGTAVASAINGKQDKLTQGTNITISGNTISATDTTYAEAGKDDVEKIVTDLT